MAFPTSPTNGQAATVNGILYIYASATRSWTRQATTATSITTGTLSASGNVTVSALTVNNSATIGTTLAVSGNVTTNNIMPFGNANANIGSGALQFNTIFAKATSAQYADLAEMYIADANYTPGTVVVFGGEQEITTTDRSHDTRVAGVISTDPAYLMNSGAAGSPVAMTGRVPCLVKGPVTKGDVLVTSAMPGAAQRITPSLFQPGCVLGKALETVTTEGLHTIEVVVGRF